MLTDTIRALLLEREGYRTKIFEFISNEHTRKNVMLVAHKSNSLASVEEIDILNIKEASLLAMKRAILALKITNIEVVVDGTDKPKINYPCKAIVKADDKIPEVMAASIVAKVYRDDLMIAFSKKYPDFSLDKNKGYPTKNHLNILKSLGPTKYHRKSFKPVLDAR